METLYQKNKKINKAGFHSQVFLLLRKDKYTDRISLNLISFSVIVIDLENVWEV